MVLYLKTSSCEVTVLNQLHRLDSCNWTSLLRSHSWERVIVFSCWWRYNYLWCVETSSRYQMAVGIWVISAGIISLIQMFSFGYLRCHWPAESVEAEELVICQLSTSRHRPGRKHRKAAANTALYTLCPETLEIERTLIRSITGTDVPLEDAHWANFTMAEGIRVLGI